MSRWSSIVVFLVVIAATILWFAFSSLTMDQRRSSEILDIKYFSTPAALTLTDVETPIMIGSYILPTLCSTPFTYIGARVRSWLSIN